MRTACLILIAAAAAAAQTPAPLSFEVASVRIADPSINAGDNFGVHFFPASGRLTAGKASLYLLLMRAYNLNEYQILGGLKWLKSEVYAIDAKAASPASEDQLRTMLQALLADRFQLKFQRETRDLQLYTLTIGKNGPKLQAPKDDKSPARMGVGRSQLTASNAPLAQLALVLSRLIGAPVGDKTGLTGNYDFTLDYDAAQLSGVYAARGGADSTTASEPNGPSI